MLKAFAALVLACVPAMAQFGAGIKIGLPLSDIADASQPLKSSTDRYLVGPQFELRLPFGFAIEADALYSRFDLANVGTAVGSTFGSVVDSSSWEFPIMAKKKFGRGLVRPFIGAGASFRKLGDLSTIGNFITGSGNSNTQIVQDSSNKGFVIGGGVELKFLFVRITPELRFTRWGTENFASGVANILKTNKSQGQLLVGISF